jgi:hypothetical protein
MMLEDKMFENTTHMYLAAVGPKVQVAEHQKLEMMTKVHGAVHELLREEEIQHLIEYLMDPWSQLDQTTAQLVFGVTPAANFR